MYIWNWARFHNSQSITYFILVLRGVYSYSDIITENNQFIFHYWQCTETKYFPSIHFWLICISPWVHTKRREKAQTRESRICSYVICNLTSYINRAFSTGNSTFTVQLAIIIFRALAIFLLLSINRLRAGISFSHLTGSQWVTESVLTMRWLWHVQFRVGTRKKACRYHNLLIPAPSWVKMKFILKAIFWNLFKTQIYRLSIVKV